MRRIIIIAGPTASGKSVLALRLARQLKAIIINADSLQLYQGLPLLTACPTATDYAEIPHFLYEYCSPQFPYSAALWAQEVMDILKKYVEIPVIIVGGTGFYLKTLIEGIAEIPLIPSQIRLQVAEEWQQKGALAFYQQLYQADSKMATQLNPTDKQRVCRAWEVLSYTGKSLQDWYTQEKKMFLKEPYELVILAPEKSWVYPLINQRVLTMLNQGVLEEITLFLKTYPDKGHALSAALGLQEFSLYLQQEISLDQAIEKTQQRSRNYAKRQSTWFRHQFKQATFLKLPYLKEWEAKGG